MPPNTQLLLLALTHWLWLSTRMYNLKKTLHFFGGKIGKKIGLSRLLYLDYDYFRNLIIINFRNLIIRLRLLQKSDFARILDYDYFRNLISLDSSITITSENYVVLDYSITITSENYVALDYSITITSEFRKLRCARLLDYDYFLKKQLTYLAITELASYHNNN